MVSMWQIIILLLLFVIPYAVVAHLLAKEKGRNVVKWTALGAIPMVNLVCIFFFAGAANLRLEQKIDELLRRDEARV